MSCGSEAGGRINGPCMSWLVMDGIMETSDQGRDGTRGGGGQHAAESRAEGDVRRGYGSVPYICRLLAVS